MPFPSRVTSVAWVHYLLLLCFCRSVWVVRAGQDDHTIQKLLATMTLEDKIGQMAQVDINDLCEDDPHEEGKKRLAYEKVRTAIGEHGVGSVLNYIQGRPFTPQEWRQAVITIQSVAKNYSRPPVIWGLDSVHGANYVHGAIMSPQPINLAATFNTTMVYMSGKLSSRDTRAVGINWLFAPLLGISIEPRWSRVYETFGEDPFVVTEMAANFIAGIQEDSGEGIPSKAAACAKHFVGYSAPHNGHDRSPSWIPTRHLFQYFLPPWKKAIQDKGVLTVMESYTEIDGVPNVANPNTLNYILRQRLGFEGVLVTDYEEILNLKNWHHIKGDEKEAVVHSLREGSVDMSMIPHNEQNFVSSVSESIDSGNLVEERINLSAERVLRLKHLLNMFQEDIVAEDTNLAKIGSESDEAQALEMATHSMVLVKNEQSVLPLDSKATTNILVTGPTSNSRIFQSGGWTGEWQGVPEEDKYFTYGSSVLNAMKAMFTNVKYACGVDILGNDCNDPMEDNPGNSGVMDQINNAYGKFKDWAHLGEGAPSSSMERAAALASASDFVVICIGEESYTEKPGDMRSLELPKGQYELISFIKSETNAKIILVYFGGRTRLLRKVVDFADAILLGFLPGPSGGQAVANILSGLANPSGKLPITYPMYDDGGGSPYFHTMSDNCNRQDDNNPLPHYEYVNCEVQWQFGFGLSYTYFEYSQLSLSTKQIHYTPFLTKPSDEALAISVSVKNKGGVAGYETVLFFTFDEWRSTTPEYKRLRSFQKVYLEPGEEKVVSASIPIDDLKFVGPHDDTHYILENGLQFRVGIGAKTDCRNGGDESALCSDLIAIDTGDDYIAACESSCQLWEKSGCSEEFGLSTDKCWEMCTSVSKNDEVVKSLGEGEEGWSWNYVKCLESIVWGFQETASTFDKKSQCGKMTLLCRDIFRTQEMDFYGHGPAVHFSKGKTVAVTIAILVSSILAFITMRGWSKKRGSEGVRGDVQFTMVTNEEMMAI